MKKVLILSAFFVGCAHKNMDIADAKLGSSSVHPCFQAITNNDFDYFKNNLETCQKQKSPSGTTPLMLAAARGKDGIINYLLQNGSDVNEQDFQMDTPLTYAVVHNQVGTVGLLILSGAELKTERPDGITVLMMALQRSSYEMIRALTLSRQELNAKAEDGWTPIYFAIRRKDPYILSLLLRQGACTNTLDSYKQTPIEFAKEEGWTEGLKILSAAPKCATLKK